MWEEVEERLGMGQALLTSRGMGETVKHGRDLAGLVGSIFPIAYVCFLSLPTGSSSKSPDHPGDPGQYLPMAFVTYLCTSSPGGLVHPLGSLTQRDWTGTFGHPPATGMYAHIHRWVHTRADCVCVCTHVCTWASAYPSSGPERRPSLSASLFPSGILP